MSFDILLGISVIICLAGLLIRFFFWFSHSIDPSRRQISFVKRLSHAIAGALAVIFSLKILLFIQSLFADLLFQKRIFNKSVLRWVTHSCIFFGFILLFFTHALGTFVFDLFDFEYVSTLNPSLMMRNIFGLMAIIGLCLAIYRRFKLKKQRLRNYSSDWIAIGLIAVIMLSGFFLESVKISSYDVYQRMNDEYGDYEDEEAEALEAYWIAENGLYSPAFSGNLDEETIALGKELHEDGSCMECHASNKNAFVSFSLSKLLGPAAGFIGAAPTASTLLFLHLAACLILLIWLPFSKMFHIVSAPASLIINRIMGKEIKDPVNGLSRQALGLSACTHCGSCTIECSAAMYYESFQNELILPSEKIQLLKKVASGKTLDEKSRQRLQKGLYICTTCDRCTDICPSGINLRDIFISARYYLLDMGTIETSLLANFSFPLALAGQYVDTHLQALKNVYQLFKDRFTSLNSLSEPLFFSSRKSIDNVSYASCYACQRCTNICPVVNSYDDPQQSLDLLPHQIIHSLGTGQMELAVGAQMLWSCTTCYLCQEHCPNSVELTDIFFRLKNMAINKIEAGETV